MLTKVLHALGNKSTDDNNGSTGGAGDLSDSTQDEVMPEQAPVARSRQQRGLQLYTTKDGRLQLLPETFTFPEMTLCSFIQQWFCGDKSNSIPPYRALKPSDVMGVKNGSQKISMMKKLMFYVVRAAKIVNRMDLIRKKPFLERDALELHHAVKHMFQFAPNDGKSRRYETMSWKTYYNLLCKRKWILMGEQVTAERQREIEKTARRPRKQRRKKESGGAAPPTMPVAPPVRPPARPPAQTPTEDTTFAAAFPSIHPAAYNQCSMGRQCRIPNASGLHACYRKCGGKIHHLCANEFKLFDPDNEMNCFCSAECMNE
eukprot:scaffold19845_cov136-Cylindrotheca_fusiformis.AAC.2